MMQRGRVGEGQSGCTIFGCHGQKLCSFSFHADVSTPMAADKNENCDDQFLLFMAFGFLKDYDGIYRLHAGI